MTRLQVRPVGGFSRAMAQTTQSHSRVCLFSGRKFKVNIKPMKNFPKVKNWTKKRTLKFSAKNAFV